MKYYAWLFVAAATIVCAAPRPAAAGSAADYNVVWNSPSTNSQGSMPLGNGDIGVNVWTENGRDLVFYLGKTDAWDENGSLLKLGKVRVSLPEGTFAAAGPFKQEFRLQDGTIQIDTGQGNAATTVTLWIDPNNPVVQVDVQRATAFNADVSFEPWRTERRQLTGKELNAACGEITGSPIPVYVEPDTVVGGQTDRILWYHRNERSVWAKNLQVQGLDPNNTVGTDVLMHNTFGAAITGANLTSVNSTTLRTSQAATHQVVSVHALTDRTDTAQQWIDQLDQRIVQTESVPYDQRKAANDQWWSNFANQSYIRVTGGPNAEAVSRGYALQRSINAFSGQGASPIKFNGSIFTVDTYGLGGAEGNLNADYRRWGGCYWFQNTRFPYWSMLQNGDFQQMQPLFDMYLQNLDVAKERVQTYYGSQGTQGAYFPETMNHWGNQDSGGYGWNNPDPGSGVAVSPYTRYEWQGGIEVTAMMLQYYDYTGDRQFVREKLLPLATEIVAFYDTHYPRDAAGKIRFEPAQSLETWWTAVNPLPEVAGLHYVLDKLLQLPEAETTAQQRDQWARMKLELPAIPTRTTGGKTIFAPGQSYSNRRNCEHPELYGVFPYLISGVGKDNLQMGIDTFNNRREKRNGSWHQDSIQAAMLGLTDTAQSLVVQNFLASSSRFPGFYGPNNDWIPDQCHPNVASIALQRMLIQVDGEQVEFFPAWPTDWDVEFRQFGPNGMIFMGDYENGAVKWMDPTADGLLSQVDYQLVMANLGYDNQSNEGDLASLLLGDVNFDGRVTDGDRAALFAAAVELGIDPSGWQVPEPGATALLATGLIGLLCYAWRKRK